MPTPRHAISHAAICPHCGKQAVHVTDTRSVDRAVGWKRRRRRCAACHRAWTTIELPLSVLAAAGPRLITEGQPFRALVAEQRRATRAGGRVPAHTVQL